MEPKSPLNVSTATHVPHDAASMHTSIELTTLGYDQSRTTTAPSMTEHKLSVGAAELRKEKIALAAVCVAQFTVGWNDASLGPLIPRLQDYYHIDFITVSMLFVAACIGYVTGAALVIYLTDRIGFGRAVILGSVIQICSYSILAIAPPFSALCCLFAINGVGVALQNTQANTMAMSMRNPGLKVGILQGIYGVGACVVPLIATQFATRPRWSFFYLVSLGLAVINCVGLSYVFRFKRLPEILEGCGIPEVVHTADYSQKNKYREMLNFKVVYVMALFSLVYVGAEVTIGGWITTFLIEARGAGESAGYVSSGFFAGLALGRVLLVWISQKIGERRAIYAYTALAIGLELVVWFVPSLVANAVAVSIAGLLLGIPFYPIFMKQSGAMFPAWLLASAVSWLSGFGQAGSALFPFLTGMVAQKHGVRAMQPLIVAMLAFIIVTWAALPRMGKRQD